MKDVVIIGGGICGCSLARELSKYQLDVLVLEKENDVSFGATKANSGISHGGYDPIPGTLMAKYNILGNRMMEGLCEELSVPFIKTGCLVVAFSEDEKQTLKDIYDRGIKNGIPKECQAIFNQDALREKEPHISDNALAAYYCSETGVVSPYELCVALMENAVVNGANISTSTKVIDIKKIDDVFSIKTNSDEYNNIETKFIVNAAGLYAADIHNMLEPSPYSIKVRRGEYYLLDKKYGPLANTVIFQCPSDKGKGVLVSPTAHGNLIVGPNAYFIDDADDTDTTPKGLEEVRIFANKTIPNIPYNANLRNYSGNRAEPSTEDFIVGEVDSVKGFFEMAGIKSPGLTSAIAIAIDMVSMLEEAGLSLKQKANFNPFRTFVHLDYLPFEDRSRLINANPLYGRIVCRCENVSEGEIIDAMRRPNGGKTIEGIKKRTRVCAGSCQGGFCTPRIVEIMARELNIEVDKIFQDKNGSFIVSENAFDLSKVEGND